MSGYDYDRPLINIEALDIFVSVDKEIANRYGKNAKATGLSNVEYKTWMPGHVFEELYTKIS